MKIKFHYDRSVHDNAAYYYELAKDCRQKLEGIETAMKQTEKEMKEAKISAERKKQEVKVRREKEWYEKFHWAFTAGGRLIIGGRNAQQNDQVFAKNMEEADLFFHADIQGGSATILKDGVHASEDELKEAAQLAGSFSNAWKNANAAVDVYAVGKDQVSKHAHGGFIPTGAFAIVGERKWFRSTPLVLRIGLMSGKIMLLPQISKIKLEKELALVPSRTGKEKGEIAKSLSKRLGVHVDQLLEILPNGKTKTIEEGQTRHHLL